MLVALGIYHIHRGFNKRALRVSLIVVDNHAKTDENDRTYIYAEYMILSGPHAGLRKLSKSGTFPPLHNKNDYLDGLYDTKTGEIQSVKSGKLTGWIIFGFAGMGALMLAIGILAAL